jgi:hypothetical protein
MVTDEFTQDLVYLMEKFNKWSGSAHNVTIKKVLSKNFIFYFFIKDARLAGGYENVPTDDIHMTQVEFNDHWLFILKEIIQPIQQKLYTGYYSDVSELKY